MMKRPNKGKLDAIKRIVVKGGDPKPIRVRIKYTPTMMVYLTEKAEALKDSFSNREIAKILKVGRGKINEILR